MSRAVRPATDADLPTLLAVQSASLAFASPTLLATAVAGPPLVLVTGRDPVGYALALGGEPTHLAELAVAPHHRGGGYGSALLRAVLARGGECRLTMRAGDERLRGFYERHGFAVADRLPGHYAGADGLLLVRHVDAEPSERS